MRRWLVHSRLSSRLQPLRDPFPESNYLVTLLRRSGQVRWSSLVTYHLRLVELVKCLALVTAG